MPWPPQTSPCLQSPNSGTIDLSKPSKSYKTSLVRSSQSLRHRNREKRPLRVEHRCSSGTGHSLWIENACSEVAGARPSQHATQTYGLLQDSHQLCKQNHHAIDKPCLMLTEPRIDAFVLNLPQNCSAPPARRAAHNCPWPCGAGRHCNCTRH